MVLNTMREEITKDTKVSNNECGYLYLDGLDPDVVERVLWLESITKKYDACENIIEPRLTCMIFIVNSEQY